MATKKKNQAAKKASPVKNDQYYKAAYARGKNDERRAQARRNLEIMHQKTMADAPKRTAVISISLYENNNCNIGINGDFSVILNKLHEIQSKSITVDKGEFFAVAAKMMAGKEGK